MADPIDPLVKPANPPSLQPIPGIHSRMQRDPYTMTYGLSVARTRIHCDGSEIAMSGGFENAPAGWTVTTSSNGALPGEFNAANHWLFELRGPMLTTERTVWFNVICVPRAE